MEIQGGSSLAGVEEGVWRSRRKSSMGGYFGKRLVFLFAPTLVESSSSSATHACLDQLCDLWPKQCSDP